MKNITSIRCGIMRFISLIILLILGLFTLNGCSQQTVKKTNDITYNKEKINTIEEMEIKEESFLFYAIAQYPLNVELIVIIEHAGIFNRRTDFIF